MQVKFCDCILKTLQNFVLLKKFTTYLFLNFRQFTSMREEIKKVLGLLIQNKLLFCSRKKLVNQLINLVTNLKIERNHWFAGETNVLLDKVKKVIHRKHQTQHSIQFKKLSMVPLVIRTIFKWEKL